MHGGAYASNPRAARAAEAALHADRNYLGLPSAYDLSREQRASFAPPRIVVRARVTGDPPMYAESVANSVFARPVPRADGWQERPSLYSPFWRVQLEKTNVEERLSIASLDGTPTWIAMVPR